VLAVISYTTFPTISIGPLHLRTFGLMVGLAVLLGSWVAGREGERWGIHRDETYRMATRMVLVGVIGARLTWDVTHWSQIEQPLDLIAVWKGGLQFSGGFIAAVLVGFPTFRKWAPLTRWRLLDGYATGLALGVAIGRIGCTAVGEHFGRPSSFFLATRYDGGAVREDTLFAHATPAHPLDGHTSPIPLTRGLTFHNTSVYELLFMLVLFAVLMVLLRRKPSVVPGTVVGMFLLCYAIVRGGLDFLRVNDETVAGLTGAQWMCLVILPIAVWMLTRVRRATASLQAAETAEAAGTPETPDPPGTTVVADPEPVVTAPEDSGRE